MRISTLQHYNISIQRMQNSNTSIGVMQRQISTGKQIHQPSDNPAVAAEVVRLNRDIAALDRYDGNMKVAENRLELEETTLLSMNTQIDRLRELTISAGAGTKNSANLQTIATEVREIVSSLAGAMNKRDAQGEYIYSGSKGFTQPYVLNADGRWEYHGDNGQREIQIGATNFVASNDSGQYLFENVEGDPQYSLSGSDFADPATRFHFDDDDAKDEWEAWVKENVQGDLHFRKRVITQNTGAPNLAQYEFQIVDSAGKVHLQHPDASAAPPVPALTGEQQNLEFNGLTLQLAALETADYEFPLQGARNGIEKITVTDQAAMDQFFADYGEVTVAMNIAGSDYQLLSARTGAPITIDGLDTFGLPATGSISFGGISMDVDSTATGVPAGPINHVLKPPSSTSSVTELGVFTGVSVNNAVVFEDWVEDAAANDILPAPGADGSFFRFEVMPGGGNYQVVDHTGAVISAAAPITASPIIDATTGLTFEYNGALQEGDAYTVQLKDSAGTATAYAESIVKMDYEQKNILNIGLDLADQLEKGNDSQVLKDALSKVLDDTLGYITEAQDRITEAVTGVGARRSAMKDTSTANQDIKLFTQTTLSAIEDADLPSVASKMMLEQTLLQASQQTFASVSQLSLFNHIG